MGAFEYTALDAGGKEQSGILEGDTPRHIRQMLRERQLLPVAVNEVAQKEATRQKSKSSFNIGRRVSASDLSLFTRQLATLVRAGLPLEESLLAVSQQTERPRIQSIVMGVRARVMEGHTLANFRKSFRKFIALPSRQASRPATSTACSSGSRTTPRVARACARKCWRPCSTRSS
jgi:general secretion pathway protein F